MAHQTKKIQGAEAQVEIKENKVIKKRKPKKYRHKELDKRIREERAETEQKLTTEAKKYGAKTPEIEKVDENTLRIEKIKGKQLKQKISEKPRLLKDLGENVAKIHSANIIHGDLTTSNAIVNEKLHIIDFGLSFRSERTEDKAVDIHLLKQVLESSHPRIAEEAWKNFLKGYKEYSGNKEVFKRLEEVEKRGRYK